MKTLQYLFFGAMATLLMAADCSNKDSEFYNDVIIASPNLIEITSADNLVVNESVEIRSVFENEIPEQGQNTSLDVFRTSGGAKSFTFSYLLERRNASEQWEFIHTDDDVWQDWGNTIGFGDFVLAQHEYDSNNTRYRYRGGIMMREPGQYRLRFTYNAPVSTNVVLTSDSLANNLLVTIYTTCEDLSGDGYYYFSVN